MKIKDPNVSPQSKEKKKTGPPVYVIEVSLDGGKHYGTARENIIRASSNGAAVNKWGNLHAAEVVELVEKYGEELVWFRAIPRKNWTAGGPVKFY